MENILCPLSGRRDRGGGPSRCYIWKDGRGGGGCTGRGEGGMYLVVETCLAHATNAAVIPRGGRVGIATAWTVLAPALVSRVVSLSVRLKVSSQESRSGVVQTWMRTGGMGSTGIFRQLQNQHTTLCSCTLNITRQRKRKEKKLVN